MRLSSTDHRDRDHLRGQNQHLELVRRHLDRDERGLKLRNLKRPNLLYDICQFILVINLKNIDLSRVLDVLCVEAQVQEFGVQADAKSGYAGSVVTQYDVTNAVYVNDSHLTITIRLQEQTQLKRRMWH